MYCTSYGCVCGHIPNKRLCWIDLILLCRLLVKVDESVERLKGLLTAQNREGVKQTTSQTVDR